MVLFKRPVISRLCLALVAGGLLSLPAYAASSRDADTGKSAKSSATGKSASAKNANIPTFVQLFDFHPDWKIQHSSLQSHAIPSQRR